MVHFAAMVHAASNVVFRIVATLQPQQLPRIRLLATSLPQAVLALPARPGRAAALRTIMPVCRIWTVLDCDSIGQDNSHEQYTYL